MKFRMLILAAAVLALAAASFGQATFNFKYYEGFPQYPGGPIPGSAYWIPLTYDCSSDPAPVINPVLMDGCVVRVMRDRTPGNITQTQYANRLNTTNGCYRRGYEVGDVGYPIGENYAAYQIMPTNEFPFNSETIPALEGGFISPLFQFVGGVPQYTPNSGGANAHGMRLYLSIGCWMDEAHTVWNSMYASADYIEVPSGYNELTCNNYVCARDPLCEPDPEDPFSYDTYFWKCDDGPCVPPVQEECEDNMTPSPLNIPEGPEPHGDINDPDQFFCVNLCEGSDLQLKIEGLRFDEMPIVHVLPGCATLGCQVACDAATFTFAEGSWVFTPVSGNFGFFTNTIFVTGDGCACVYVEDILPVEMGSIAITPRDASVELTWNTLAESNLDHFNVLRNGELRATINASAEEGMGANYSYVDEARNGVTYSYSLVVVEENGSETVLAETEATPNANLAVITEYALHQNYPNPFNPTTSIVFDVVESNHVTLTVYNAMGQEVATLVNGVYNNGRHNVEFSSDNLTSGLYFYNVKIGNEFTATKKMLLVK